MGQADVLNLLKRHNPKKLWTTKKISKKLKTSNGCTTRIMRILVKYKFVKEKWLGVKRAISLE